MTIDDAIEKGASDKRRWWQKRSEGAVGPIESEIEGRLDEEGLRDEAKEYVETKSKKFGSQKKGAE